jgi:hypothetical protein
MSDVIIYIARSYTPFPFEGAAPDALFQIIDIIPI